MTMLALDEKFFHEVYATSFTHMIVKFHELVHQTALYLTIPEFHVAVFTRTAE